MGDKTNKKYLIIGIIVFILIVIISVFTGTNLFEQNIDNDKTGLYHDIGIDNSELNVLFLNVGQADCTFITINGKNMLIDAGNDSDGYYIVEFLKEQNVTTIDYLIGTHVDEDHIGGLDEIINAFDIENLYIPKKITNDSDYVAVEDAVKNKPNLTIDEKEQGYIFMLDDAMCKILSDKEIETKDTNATSIIIELTYKDVSFLFMADIPKNIENSIEISNREKGIDVLKVAHHGSDSSTSDEFLKLVKPRLSIISVDNKVSSKHPNSTIIKNLEKTSEVYRTDIDGTIWIKSDGYEIQSEKRQDINVDGNGRKVKTSMFNALEYYLLCYINDKNYLRQV